MPEYQGSTILSSPNSAGNNAESAAVNILSPRSPSRSNTEYTASLATLSSNNSGGRLPSRPSSRDTSPSKMEASLASLPPHLTHRRSRTEVISLPSSIRRASLTSFEDVNLDSSEEPLAGRSGSSSEPKMAQSLWTSTRSHKRLPIASSLRQVTSANPFSSFFASSKPKELKVPDPADDEFLNLDVDAALFPPGARNDLTADEAFRNLHENAERVIQQLQKAYKLRTFALHETLADKQSQSEELEESAARLKEIKSQLDAMAARAEEQDRAMRALAEELKTERENNQREEATEARRSRDERARTTTSTATNGAGAEKVVILRDSKQSSRGTTLSSDSGFESGDESIAESTLSSRRNEEIAVSSLVTQSSSTSVNTTTTTTAADSTATTTTPTPTQAPSTPTLLMSPPSPSRSYGTQTQLSPSKAGPQSPSSRSAYDRVMKGISSSGIGSSITGLITTSRCSNCHGLSASEAWSVVSMLKYENKALKNRMSELESAVDECITLVGG